ncbi:trypsin-like peptidase domain-containing protein [Streptomyces sp. ISL-96]|uniref:VMAP-C domain-containing protein n=1 Tax=Streptomyces sp. ISL-96 TaxID=2819191 RepID=UPI001BE99CD0|nr:trypsin-like peptidase domain-containing protein [Streptomyces sp. ISL-96]MBT2493766.1 trypsin-like peptidase domain-containing protein [Streptomyces sp. ISL-96]
MGWFKAADDADEDPSLHVVSVRRTEDGKAAGAGFVLGADTVLTCAHVVNDALGRAMFEYRSPGPVVIRVQVSDASRSQLYLARVAHWIPPRARDDGAVREGDGEWLGDLAVLRVDGPAEGLPAAPDRVAMAVGQEVGAWHGGGRAASLARLTVVSLHGSRGYLDGEATGMAVGPGYSGGPLWCRHERAVVGLVVAHFMPPLDPATGARLAHSPQHLIRRSWGIPWQRVEAELRPLGLLDHLTPEALEPEDPAFVLLVEVIKDVLPSPNGRRDSAQRLARACGVGYGSDVTPPTPEEFAAFLLTHPRALAAFSGTLRRDSPAAADRLLAAGCLSRTPRLLSPQEYAQLRKHLRTMDRAVLGRFPEAVRAALPHLAALPGGDTLDALLDHLEALPGDGHSAGGERRVPALLRVMEYVGAMCPGPKRAQLRLWADGVAGRLSIARAALGERRLDAQEWARSARDRSARVRVLVQVTGAERRRHRLRIWCDEGAGPRQVSTASVVSYSASEAAREVLRVLDSLTPPAGDDRPPLLEVLVDRTSLNLPVDEWEARDPIVPGVLGVEFPLVVHCPELLRRHGRFLSHWRSRWGRLDSGKTFVVSEPMDRDMIYSRLVNQLDTVRVFVDVPPGPRDGIVQTCLALGIPVVVWDRGRDGASHVVKHMAEVATRELPDGVRSYRANAKASPPEFPGRPVLAWADADQSLPRLHLTEPQESA